MAAEKRIVSAKQLANVVVQWGGGGEDWSIKLLNWTILYLAIDRSGVQLRYHNRQDPMIVQILRHY